MKDRIGMIIVITALILFLAYSLYLRYVSTKITSPFISALNGKKIVRLINRWRVAQGYAPYTIDDTVCDITKRRLNHLENMSFFYKLFYLKEDDLTGRFVENISRDQDKEEEIVRYWLAKKESRENLEMTLKLTCVICDKKVCVQEITSF